MVAELISCEYQMWQNHRYQNRSFEQNEKHAVSQRNVQVICFSCRKPVIMMIFPIFYDVDVNADYEDAYR